MLPQPIFLLALCGSALAASVKVAVGSGGLKYEPASLTAVAGDTVTFEFSSVSHNVVQSTFESPCSPMANGFYVPPQSSSSVSFTITVNNTDPVYFYCSVGNHCTAGMVGIINPVSGKSQSDFANAAKSATISKPAGSDVIGGVLSDGSSSSSSSASSSTRTGSSSSSTSGSATGSTSSAGSAASSSSKAGGTIPTSAPAALAVIAGALAAYL